MMFRRLLFLAGMILILPIGLLITLATFTPITPSGALYLLGMLLIAAGAMSAPWRGTHFGASRAGLLLICLIAGTRLMVAGRGTTATLITLPGAERTLARCGGLRAGCGLVRRATRLPHGTGHHPAGTRGPGARIAGGLRGDG